MLRARRPKAVGGRRAGTASVLPPLPFGLRVTRYLAPATHHLALGSILVVFMALALGYALATPAWNNPDEPAHYNYVLHVAETGQLPELLPGDWDAQRLEFLKAHRFPPGESIASIRYESHQPPLYYLVATPVLLVSEPFGQQAAVLALRALSIPLGALLVLVAYGVAQIAVALPPADARAWGVWPLATRYVPLLTAGLVTFIPMHTAMSAAINNDVLANLLSGLLVLALLWGLLQGFRRRGLLIVGLLCGLLLVTKLTAYGLVPLALTTVGLASMAGTGGLISPRAWLSAARALGLVAIPMAFVAGGWLLRQATLYGWNDLLASGRHELVVVDQPRWSDLPVEPLSYFATTLFHSFWAQFGWMGILVDDRLYRLFGLFSVLALFGLALHLQQRNRLPLAPLLLLAAACLVVFAQVVYYNLIFVQPQGRYLFPALAPLATLLALGWASLVGHGRAGRALAAAWLVAAAVDGGSLLLGIPLSTRVVYGAAVVAGAVVGSLPARDNDSSRLQPTLVLGIIPALALLDFVCLTRFVLPGFAV